MTTLMEQETLGERFRVGDGAAMHELYERYSAPMYATALTLLGNREHAADAVQRLSCRRGGRPTGSTRRAS